MHVALLASHESARQRRLLLVVIRFTYDGGAAVICRCTFRIKHVMRGEDTNVKLLCGLLSPKQLLKNKGLHLSRLPTTCLFPRPLQSENKKALKTFIGALRPKKQWEGDDKFW